MLFGGPAIGLGAPSAPKPGSALDEAAFNVCVAGWLPSLCGTRNDPCGAGNEAAAAGQTFASAGSAGRRRQAAAVSARNAIVAAMRFGARTSRAYPISNGEAR